MSSRLAVIFLPGLTPIVKLNPKVALLKVVHHDIILFPAAQQNSSLAVKEAIVVDGLPRHLVIQIKALDARKPQIGRYLHPNASEDIVAYDIASVTPAPARIECPAVADFVAQILKVIILEETVCAKPDHSRLGEIGDVIVLKHGPNALEVYARVIGARPPRAGGDGIILNHVVGVDQILLVAAADEQAKASCVGNLAPGDLNID